MARRGKVRVYSSVLNGYEFLFERPGRLLHVAWFPGALFVIAGIIANDYMSQIDVLNMSNTEARDALIRLLQIMTVYSFFQLAMTLVVIVGLYRVALNDFRPRGPLYFRFLTDELRTASIWFLVVIALYMLFMALVYSLIFVITGYIGVSTSGSGAGGILIEVMTKNRGVLFWVWAGISALLMFGAYTRFFLAMPAALEHRVTTLGEVWTLTKGNGVRLALYVLLLIVSLVVFILFLQYLVQLAAWVAAAIYAVTLSPEAVEAVAQQSKNLVEVIANLPTWGRYLIAGLAQIVAFFIYIFFWAIVIGSASSAFRDIFPRQSA